MILPIRFSTICQSHLPVHHHHTKMGRNHFGLWSGTSSNPLSVLSVRCNWLPGCPATACARVSTFGSLIKAWNVSVVLGLEWHHIHDLWVVDGGFKFLELHESFETSWLVGGVIIIGPVGVPTKWELHLHACRGPRNLTYLGTIPIYQTSIYMMIDFTGL